MIGIGIRKVISIFGIKKNFWVVIIGKNSMNCGRKGVMGGNGREGMDKIVNRVKMFGIGIGSGGIWCR